MGEFVSENKMLIKKWDYDRNKNINPNEITIGSHKKVFWKCEKHNHEWEETIKSESNRKNFCPYCSNTKILAGYNDLKTKRPDLEVEWNYEKNDIYPEKVLEFSNKVVNWKCKRYKHEWSARIADRSKGDGCPYCSNARVLVGFNDLATVEPEIAEEWNYEKNDGKLPTQYTRGSIQNINWKCKKYGHEWKVTINSRTSSNSNCPICSGRKVLTGFNDLATVESEIAEEWNYEKNDGKLPTQYTRGSTQNIDWKCKRYGHEWKATINSRTNMRSNCPYCEGTRVLEGFNDLATINPELAKEWNYKKNGEKTPKDYTSNSGKKVYWKCEKHNHEWSAQIASRNNGMNCPYCSGRKVLIGFNDLETVNPTLAEEWDYEKNNGKTPKDYTGNSGKKVYWKCKRKGHSWIATIVSRNSGGGCKECSKGRRTSFPEQVLYYNLKNIFELCENSYYPDWMEGKEIDIFIKEINLAIEYDGRFHNREKDEYKNVILRRNKVPLIRIIENSKYSEIMYKEKDIIYIYYKPKNGYKNLGSIYNLLNAIINLNFKLSNKFEFSIDKYKSDILSKIRNVNYEKSMGYMYPYLLEFWSDANGEISPFDISYGTKDELEWICSKQHRWSERVRKGKISCPFCTGRKVLEGFNDLATINSELANEWNYELNKDLKPTQVTANSHKKVYWKCKEKGHVWLATIANRNNGKTRCKKCIEEGIIPRNK